MRAKFVRHPQKRTLIVQKFAEHADAKATLSWDDVRYFLELARQGKLTAAAKALDVEHSTVSRRVTALEKRIGLRLFDRLPKCWKLTMEGAELVVYAQRIEEEALAFSRASMGIGAVEGIVRLSAPPVLASHFLAPHLATLRRQRSGIAIHMLGEARQANLYRREADLAVRLSPPEEAGLAGKPLAEMGYGLYATATWLERPTAEWEFVGYSEALRETPQQAWLEELSAGRPFAFLSNDLASVYMACRMGLGFAVLPHFLARHDPSLCVHPDYRHVLSRPIWMVVHPDVRRSPRVRAVADFVSVLFREQMQTFI